MEKNLFETYEVFVGGLLSEPSKDLETLISRMRSLQSTGCDVSKLLTGACRP